MKIIFNTIIATNTAKMRVVPFCTLEPYHCRGICWTVTLLFCNPRYVVHVLHLKHDMER